MKYSSENKRNLQQLKKEMIQGFNSFYNDKLPHVV